MSAANLKVRPAVLADLPTVVEFNRRLARETEAKELDVELLRRGVAEVLGNSSRGRYFVAEADGEVVGQLMHTFEWSDWRNGEIWWIQSVYVRADHRKAGVFRRLHGHLRELAKATPHVVGLRLYVEHANAGAQAVYAKAGFRSEGYLVLGDLWGDADHS